MASDRAVAQLWVHAAPADGDHPAAISSVTTSLEALAKTRGGSNPLEQENLPPTVVQQKPAQRIQPARRSKGLALARSAGSTTVGGPNARAPLVTLSCTQGGSSQGGERRTCEARKRRKCADAKQATVQAREMQPAAKRTEKREPKGKPPCPTAREVEARDKNARGAKATETSLVVHNGGAAKSKETALVMHDGGPVKSTDTALVVHDGGAGKRRFGANVAALVHEHPLFTAGGSQLILVIMSRGQGPAGFGSSSRAA